MSGSEPDQPTRGPASGPQAPPRFESPSGLRSPASDNSAKAPKRTKRRGQGKRITKAAPRPVNANKADLKQAAETTPAVPLRRTLRGILRLVHPKQALLIAAVIGVLISLMGRPVREALVGALAVLLTQVAMGILNDLLDRDADETSEAPKKPIPAGDVAPGTAGFLLFLVLLLSIPAALQNGLLAGLFLLATLLVGFVHNRFLKRGPLSFVGWCLTFALYVPFLTYGRWGLGAYPTPATGAQSLIVATLPTTAALATAAAVGLAAHFATAVPDLVHDHRSGARTLPLRIGVLIGARGLLVLTVVLSIAAVAGFVWAALSVGLAA